MRLNPVGPHGGWGSLPTFWGISSRVPHILCIYRVLGGERRRSQCPARPATRAITDPVNRPAWRRHTPKHLPYLTHQPWRLGGPLWGCEGVSVMARVSGCLGVLPRGSLVVGQNTFTDVNAV